MIVGELSAVDGELTHRVGEFAPVFLAEDHAVAVEFDKECLQRFSLGVGPSQHLGGFRGRRWCWSRRLTAFEFGTFGDPLLDRR